MKKFLIGIILIIIAAVAWFGVTLDNRIKTHIEKTASYLTGVAVTIESIDFSVFEGEGIINGLAVANPEGYSEGKAFVMDTIKLELDSGTLFSQPLVVNKLVFDSPVINLEFKDNYESNLQDILEVSNRQTGHGSENTSSGSSEESGSGSQDQTASSSDDNNTEPDEETEEKYFRMKFDVLEINNITLNAQHGDEEWSDTVSSLQMDNLGGVEGIGTRELGITVVRELISQTLKQAATRTITDVVKEKAVEFGTKLLEKLLE